MPQIDFGKALSNGDAPPRQGKIYLGLPPLEDATTSSSWFERHHLGLPEYANIIFTSVAILGGLFCAFYFFNGSDLVRSVRHWPRQYFYARPVPMNRNGAPFFAAGTRLPNSPATENGGKASGSRFSPSDQRVTLNQPQPPGPIGSFAPLNPSSAAPESAANSAAGNSGSGSGLPAFREPASSGNSVTPNVTSGTSALRSGGRASRGRSIASAQKLPRKPSFWKRLTLAATGKKRTTVAAAKRRGSALAKSRTTAAHNRTRAVAGGGKTRSAASSFTRRGGQGRNAGGHGQPSSKAVAIQQGRIGQSHSTQLGRGMANRQSAGSSGGASSSLSSMGRGLGGMGSTGLGVGVGAAARGGAPAGPGMGGGGFGLGGGFHGHGGGRR